MTSSETGASAMVDATRDVFLGGKLHIEQPAKGYRAGLDAVLLAACVRDGKGTSVLDLGAGAGTAGLCVAARLPQTRVVLFEREPVLHRISVANIESNRLAGRVVAVEGDIAGSNENLKSLGLEQETFDWVIANPPYHDEGAGTRSSNMLKAASHEMDAAGIETWARFMARMAKPGGMALIVHKAEALGRILAALDGRFGALTILPISPRIGDDAHRVIVRGTKGSRAPMTLKPAFVVHEAGQTYTPAAERILRHAGPLDF